jgi:3-oxoacyl-[acyl-carrier-protein] synthase III
MSNGQLHVEARTRSLTGVQILGTGSYVPENVVSNHDLRETHGFDPDWIVNRTGILERRFALPHQATSDLCAVAAVRCLEAAGCDPSEIDLLVVGTFTPDMCFPSTANLVQDRLNLNCPAFDVQAACAGFVYALATAAQFVATGTSTRALVIGGDCNSRVINPGDQKSFPLFGDGAGAVLLAASDEPTGLLAHQLGSDGSKADLLHIPAGGSAAPSTAETVAAKGHYIQMEGRAVFKFAVRAIVDSTRAVLDAAGMQVGDVDLFVPHQANARIIDAAAESVGLPKGRVFTNVERYGNTSAASIPIALCEAIEEGRLRPGDNVLMCGFGAGLTWGTAIFQWGVPLSAPATEPWRSLASSMNGRADRARAIARRAVAGVGA